MYKLSLCVGYQKTRKINVNSMGNLVISFLFQISMRNSEVFTISRRKVI